jgi:hypothetical protein
MKPKIKFFIFYLILTSLFLNINKAQNWQIGWPDISNITKPWARWWWMGGSVNKDDLSKCLEQYSLAGLGGLEVTNIYGVKGYESQFIRYTSPEWMKNLEFALSEAKKNNLGVDLALASGWPFGGPWVTKENACKYYTIKTYNLKEGEKLNEKISFTQKTILRIVGKKVEISELKDPVSENQNLQELALDQVRFPVEIPLQVLMAYSDKGEKINITDKIGKDGLLNWTAPKGNWTLYALFMGWHGKLVERAGPGGEGDVIDHFSAKAINEYLSHFDNAFNNINIDNLRAFFNDSYEVDDAQGESNWTPEFFNEFQKRRGYDLRNYLKALAGNDSEDTNIRVLCDFRETISDLILDNYTKPWQKWAQNKGKIIRNQAHGSPANILDLYAASDIPETEGTNILNIKFASSAAHVTGKNLVSSESATWLNEHFLSNLAQVKENIDRYFIGGINHIFYHGTTYSPINEQWPGWMFYAAVHFAPTNTIWKDFPTLNEYIARVQSFLQNSAPDNDILLYFPVYDDWSEPGKSTLLHYHGPHENTPVYSIAELLQNKGYSFDYISDKQIINLYSKDKMIYSGNVAYKTIIVPSAKYMPFSTFNKIYSLAKNGATIIFIDKLPESVPGLSYLDENQKSLIMLKEKIKFNQIDSELKMTKIGSGKILLGSNTVSLLNYCNIKNETLVEKGLQFFRFKKNNSILYFINNWSDKYIDEYIPVNHPAKTVVIYDPMNKIFGKALIKTDKNQSQHVYLQLAKGQSCILQLISDDINIQNYNYWKKSEDALIIDKGWNITFVEGGPELPAKKENIKLTLWTDLNDNIADKFSGSATYSVSFKKPALKAQAWMLNLGEVFESANIKINGQYITTLIGPTFSCIIPDSLIKDDNFLEITVTNLMANRIIDMEKNGIEYRKFYNVNFPARLKENRGANGLFTAINWKPQKSGLAGPVEIIPLFNLNHN